jgi:hypothetical protein
MVLGGSYEAEFAALSTAVDPLTLKAPDWYELVYLAAILADHARDEQRALTHYVRLDDLDKRGRIDRKRIPEATSDSVRERITALSPRTSPATDVPAISPAPATANPTEKIQQDAEYAVAILQRLFHSSTTFEKITLLDERTRNAYIRGKEYFAHPQVQYLPEVSYHEMALMFLLEFKLPYSGESGAIVQSYADSLAAVIKQRQAGQRADTADWLLAPGGMAWSRGEDVATTSDWTPIRSLRAPGTAYSGDAQVAHYSRLRDSPDPAAVYVNSGIGNRAFYETAIRIGTDPTTQIWLAALPPLAQDTDPRYPTLARLTYEGAGRLYGQGSIQQLAVGTAWNIVGVDLGNFAVGPTPEE